MILLTNSFDFSEWEMQAKVESHSTVAILNSASDRDFQEKLELTNSLSETSSKQKELNTWCCNEVQGRVKPP